MTRAASRIALLAGGLALAAVASAAAQTAPPAAQAPAPSQGTRAPAAPQAAPPSAPGTAPQAPRPQGGVTPTATDRVTVERRRNRTYAGCNRAALRRALKGGERRRFITRCRLGYDIPPRTR